jgi:hypothetical protein
MKIGSFEVPAEVNHSREEKTFADLNPEQREKCRKFWLKFRILERVSWLSFLTPLLATCLFPGVVAKVPRVIFLAPFALWFGAKVWLYNLSCPLCGAKFSGGLITLLPRLRYPWDCYGCGLSRRELRYISMHHL